MDNQTAADPVVEARLAELRARFPDGIEADDEPQVRTRIARGLRLAAGMRAIDLTNGDQPFVSIAAMGDTDHAQ
ncbi:MAG TPA: hypothetical protein PK691_07310 [Thermomicrobiales bacterium]|nr:hypothetical protein [Thermomicrobiales bacterium]HRA49118.1 hypothetical protein [Thermomicrobiales bacterium]